MQPSQHVEHQLELASPFIRCSCIASRANLQVTVLVAIPRPTTPRAPHLAQQLLAQPIHHLLPRLPAAAAALLGQRVHDELHALGHLWKGWGGVFRGALLWQRLRHSLCKGPALRLLPSPGPRPPAGA